MALTKTTIADRIEVVSDFKHIQIRDATVIKDDSKEISRSFHRRVLTPGRLSDAANNTYTQTDISSESTEVQGIANTVWTSAVHDAWKAELIATKDEPGVTVINKE